MRSDFSLNTYRRSTTETIMHTIGQNILLNYPHFGIDFLHAASLSTPISFYFFSPSEDQKSLPLRGSFSSVRVLLNEEHCTAENGGLAMPPFIRALQGARGSLLWLMSVALSAGHATQNQVVSNLGGR